MEKKSSVDVPLQRLWTSKMEHRRVLTGRCGLVLTQARWPGSDSSPCSASERCSNLAFNRVPTHTEQERGRNTAESLKMTHTDSTHVHETLTHSVDLFVDKCLDRSATVSEICPGDFSWICPGRSVFPSLSERWICPDVRIQSLIFP